MNCKFDTSKTPLLILTLILYAILIWGAIYYWKTLANIQFTSDDILFLQRNEYFSDIKFWSSIAFPISYIVYKLFTNKWINQWISGTAFLISIASLTISLFSFYPGGFWNNFFWNILIVTVNLIVNIDEFQRK